MEVTCKYCHKTQEVAPWRAKKFIYCNKSCMNADPVYLKNKSCAMSGDKHPFWGKCHSEETKRKMSDSHKGLLKGRVITTESREKISNTLKKYYKDPCNHPRFGAKLSDKTKLKISKAHIGKSSWNKGKKFSKTTREKMSAARTKIVLSGELRTNKLSKQGWFFSIKNNCKIHYDSSWELQAYQILEQMSEVVAYSKCDFHIEYKWTDSMHRYHPDIRIVYKSGQIDIVEVKPIWKLEDSKVKAKKEAAEIYCSNRNLRYCFWTEKELNGKSIDHLSPEREIE